jgi:N utilization substance protein A
MDIDPAQAAPARTRARHRDGRSRRGDGARAADRPIERTDGHYRVARAEMDKKTGRVTIWAREEFEVPAEPEPVSPEARVGARVGTRGRRRPGPALRAGPRIRRHARGLRPRGRVDGPPGDRQQRLREVEDEQMLGDFKGREGDIIAGVIQQSSEARGPVDLGTVEGILPLAEQVPGETYKHGDRIRCYVVARQARPARPADRAVAHAPQPGAQAVRAGGAGDRGRHREDRGTGPRGGAPDQDRRAFEHPGINAKGACIGPMGARVRAVMAELRGEKIDIVDYSPDPAEFVAAALSPARVLLVSTVVDPVAQRPGSSSPTISSRLAIGREGQNARLAAKLTGWRIDIRPDVESHRPLAAPPGPATGGPRQPPRRRSRRPARMAGPTGLDCVGPMRGLARPPARASGAVSRIADRPSAHRRGRSLTSRSRSWSPIRAVTCPGRGCWLHPTRTVSTSRWRRA